MGESHSWETVAMHVGDRDGVAHADGSEIHDAPVMVVSGLNNGMWGACPKS